MRRYQYSVPVLLSLDLSKDFKHLRCIEVNCSMEKIPSLIPWLQSSTSDSTSILMSSITDQVHRVDTDIQRNCCPGYEGPAPQTWRNLDDAFRHADLKNVEKLKIKALWFGGPHDHAQCVRNYVPYLSSQKYFELAFHIL
jgi:hypothetical protein